MYWIKADRGDAVNLALATDVVLQPPRDCIDVYTVVAFFPHDDDTTIGRGTKEEMTGLRDKIVNDLLAATAAKWR